MGERGVTQRVAAGTGLLAVAGRYGVAGLLNTLVGFGLILALEFGAGVDAGPANALGFAAGLVASYLLNRSFVFRGVRRRRGTVARFLVAFSVAFGINQLVLATMAAAGPADMAWRWGAQAAAVGSYTLVMFLLCHLWVYRAT